MLLLRGRAAAFAFRAAGSTRTRTAVAHGWAEFFPGDFAVVVLVEFLQVSGGLRDFGRVDYPVVVGIERLHQGHGGTAVAGTARTAGRTITRTPFGGVLGEDRAGHANGQQSNKRCVFHTWIFVQWLPCSSAASTYDDAQEAQQVTVKKGGACLERVKESP